MGKFLTGFVAGLEGKKTAIGGALVILGAATAVFYGKLDATTGLALTGAGFTALGLSDRLNRHQAEVLTAIQGVAQAGADYRAGKTAQAVQDVGVAAAPIAEQVISASFPVSGGVTIGPLTTAPISSPPSTGVVSPGAAAISSGTSTK